METRRSLLPVLWLAALTACVCGPAAAAAEPAPEGVAAAPGAEDDGIARLVRDLGGSRDAAKAARDRLVQIGPPAVPTLVAALQAPDFSTRWGAANVLGYLQDKRALMPLVERVLHDPNNHVRWRSIWAINQMHGEVSSAALRGGLTDPDSTVRWNAAVALSTLQDPACMPVLVEGLHSGSSWVRWEAVNALGRVHDEKTAQVLLPLLADPDTRIRQETALSLGSLGGETVVAGLIGALADREPGVRWRAAAALARTGAVRAVAPLTEAVANERDSFARREMEKALDRLRNAPEDPGRPAPAVLP